MKKLFCLVLSIISAVLFSTAVFGADITSDLIGKFSFEGNVVNEVTGEEAVTIGKAFGLPLEKEWKYIDGVNGTAIILNEQYENAGRDEEKSNTNGLKLQIAPKDGKNYTVSIWCKAIDARFSNPIIWLGSSTPLDDTWVSLDNGLTGNYESGPQISSNSIDGKNISADVSKGLALTKNLYSDNLTTFDWTNITMVVENGVGKLYYDGQLITDTGVYSKGDYRKLPDVVNFFKDKEDISFYLGTNKYDEPFVGYIDELYIYDRALSEDDINELVKESNFNGVTLGEFDTMIHSLIYYEDIPVFDDPHGYYEKEDGKVVLFDIDFALIHDEKEKILNKAVEISKKYDVHIFLMTYGSLNENLKEYAQNIDVDDPKQVIVIIDEEAKKCAVKVGEEAKKSISKYYGSNKIASEVTKKLKKGDAYIGFIKALDLIEDFEKEAEFLLPYGIFNTYKTVFGIIVRIIIILLVAFILFRNIKKNSTKLKEYSKGREPFIKPEVSEFKKTPPYIIKFKTGREEFIQKINEMCKLKYVPDDFTVERFYDDITEMYLEYYSVMGVKESSDTLRFGWMEDKDTYFRVLDEYTILADDSLIKTIEPYEGDDIEVARMDKSVGELERRISMPAWVLNVTYNGKIYTFVMNGQTGKFAGQVPLDYKKYKKEKMTKVVMILVTVIIVLLII